MKPQAQENKTEVFVNVKVNVNVKGWLGVESGSGQGLTRNLESGIRKEVGQGCVLKMVGCMVSQAKKNLSFFGRFKRTSGLGAIGQKKKGDCEANHKSGERNNHREGRGDSAFRRQKKRGGEVTGNKSHQPKQMSANQGVPELSQAGTIHIPFGIRKYPMVTSWQCTECAFV